MANIDFSKVISAETRALEKAKVLESKLKNECRVIISSAVSARALINLQGAVLTGELSGENEATFKAGLRWIKAMQNECRRAIRDEQTPNWPDVPQGFEALVDEY